MARSLSNDLCWRVIRAYETQEATFRQLVERFGTGTASITRDLALYRKNARRWTTAHGSGKQAKVDAKGLELMAHIVRQHRDAT